MAGNGEDGGLCREKRERSMKYSIADGMSYTVMAGMGDSFLPAAIISLGASNFYVGLLAALPQLIGASLQSFSLSALRLFKDRRLMVAAGSLLQALSWLPIIALLLWPGELSVPLIIAFFTIGAGTSLMINPAWSSWISDIVPENERAGFFANRNRLMQAVLFMTVFGAGMALRELQLNYPAGAAFAAVFSLAFLSRLFTVFCQLKTENVKYELALAKEIQFKHLFLLPAYKNELSFLAFMGLFTFSVQFSAPFFTPYMMNSLGLDMGAIGTMTAALVLTKIVAFPYWGKAIDRFGNRTVLVAASLGATTIPLLWLFTTDFRALLLFQAVSGFVWAGFDLAAFNYALSLVGRELRPAFIAKYNSFNGLFFAAGALAGGWFLTSFPAVSLFGFDGILLVFLLSGVARIGVVLFFAPRLHTGDEIYNKTEERAVIMNLVAVYPTRGAVQQVLNGYDFTRKIVEKGTLHGGIALKSGLGATGEAIKEGGRKVMSAVSRKKHL
ncbi:MAG: MFS transporter [Candidatus Micrarchaeia archaeon]